MKQRSWVKGVAIVAGVLALVTSSFLAACGGQPTPTPTPAPTPPPVAATPTPAPTPAPTPLPKVVWDWPFVFGPGHWNVDPYVEFMEALDKETDGGFVIQAHPRSSLYGLFDSPKATIEGKLQINAELLALNTWDILPALSVLEMPMLIPAEKEEAALKAIFPWAKGLLEKQGLKVIGRGSIWPRQVIYTVDRPLRKVEDWKGLKIRVYNKPGGDMVKALGGSPVTIPTAEVYVSLQRKVADGLITSIGNIPAFKLDELVKYINDWSYVVELPGYLVVNKAAWDALPQPYQQAFQRLYRDMDVENEVKQRSVPGVENSIATGRKVGMEIVEPPSAEIARARKLVEPVWKEWLTAAGDDGREALDILFDAGILERAWWR